MAERIDPDNKRPWLKVAIGKYPSTEALLSGQIRSDLIALDFANIKTINRAFAPMVREAQFDVCEMAIGTFIQAKAYGVPLVLLPIVLAARFQETAFLCTKARPVRGGADLKGRRVGVRAYSQTTGMWLRGIINDIYRLRPDQVHWVTFEDAHVPSYRDPTWTERASPGQDMMAMLRAGELDAVIVGNDLPDDQDLCYVFEDVTKAQQIFWGIHHFVPINHMVTIRRELIETHPWVASALMEMFRQSSSAEQEHSSIYPPDQWNRANLENVLNLALRYAEDLLPRPMTLREIWDGLPGDIA